MEKLKEFRGIKEHLGVFREAVKDAERIGFAGVPGVCTPFAQLFAYAVRDKDNIFIPNTDFSKARKLEVTEYGVELGEISPGNVDVLVLLGGLSMPGIGSDIEDVKKLVEDALEEGGELMGLCYMDMFARAGWYELLDFDCVINADIDGYVLRG
ncbi:conserved protein [Methanothermobacter thermautotrophicus str. Delta H]|uniref:Uncharacterized protein MTH_862 n=2 Tax=Methanothermobacter thermautotrophicus (strain ATCC 29096 / DSM 1053 / JCM 10044 / NBRC 100330 / Delta H) TaxID=187420 RepID=Y862_METTH|nr:DUF2124 family protein [Methanothermobacter thermautotrophicus]O26950.1 RecName: Full=Uncharacterized protein MTH_862 [Methanothermobacter thermautotrophicus str. Delta H]AAB85360.1 conserved protein [Methanothermobacter thermautotrophicus str. Delta H]WBF07078.1 DUF2124 family protein [Methanothermobacter thermautotrophicus]